MKMKKQETNKPKKKKWPIVLAVVLVLCFVAAMGGNSGDDPPPSDSSQITDSSAEASAPIENPADIDPNLHQSVPDETDADDAVTVKFGELLSVTDNRDSNGIVVVKAKITPNLTNEMTISQNYHNAVDLIANQGFDSCEFQYWAVADMTDGSEGKVISFTVPSDVVDQVANGGIVATQLPDHVTDLWILPSLQD